MSYLFWVAVLLSPYWLGPIVVWATERWSTHPVFEPFDPTRHTVPDDVAAAFRQTCGALAGEGFRTAADLFYAASTKRVNTRVALLDRPGTAEIALAVAVSPPRGRRASSRATSNSLPSCATVARCR